MSLIDKLKKNSIIKETDILENSKIFNKKDLISTSIPALNIAFSGQLDGGFTPGVTMWCGPSKHFKTGFALLMAKAYMDKYPESVLLFYDSEFGAPKSYFETFGINMQRVVHTPLMNIEELKFDCVSQLEGIDKNDKLIIIIDSIGNIASKKEIDDAIDGKSVADMSRAKQIKSFFRMVTPYLTMKDIPMVVVNHSYKEIGLFPKDIVSGGCVVKGTKIQTPNGLKNVEDFLQGDKVLTLNGNHNVTEVWNPDTLLNGEPECYEIEFEDGFKVVCSADHKFIVNDKWVEAKNIKVNMDCKTI